MRLKLRNRVVLLRNKKPYIDLATRSGLKKVHANFNVIYNRIDKAYQRDLGNYKIRGGIVGIFAKMCVDSILRNKLFEKGAILFCAMVSSILSSFVQECWKILCRS